MKILLVEDDVNLSNDLKHQLLFEKFEVDTVFDGLLAERLIIRTMYDCILLDINIPGKNGYELTKEIRKRQINTPIIMITAYGELDDKLFGFENGADDYITKPFYFKELLARIKVFLRRSDQKIIDHNKKQIFRNGLLIKLTPREYEIMDILVKANGNPLSKTQLLQKVWGTN